MTNDIELLRHYVESGSEEAFAELVRRHIDFVYAAALRHVNGSHRAEDVVQTVFTDLARKAGKLSGRADLVGWLYLSTRYAALTIIRSEVRREAREKEAQMIYELTVADGPEVDWDKLRPTLDKALHDLGEADRSAILRRFFCNESFAGIAGALGVSEESARKRVDRALEKLHALLKRRGITSTASALALALAQQPAIAAPGGLAATVIGTALASTAAVGTGAVTTATVVGFMSASKSIVAVAIVVTALTVGMVWSEVHRVETAKTTAPVLRSESSDLSALLATNDLAVLIARLRAAGFPNNAIRAVIEQKLKERYPDSSIDPDAPFWKPMDHAETARRENENLRLLAERSRIMRELLGSLSDHDEGEITPEQRRRYGALAPAKIQQLERLNADYAEMETGLLAAMNNTTLPEDREKFALLAREKRADLAALLSPAELGDYDMRNSPTTERLRPTLALFKATEDEFRVIFKIQESFVDRLEPRTGNIAAMTSEERNTLFNRAQPEAQAHLKARLQDALGAERYADFSRANNRDYQQLVSLTERENLPREAADQVYRFRDEASAESTRISGDATLTPEQKTAALQFLAENTRARLLATLGQTAGPSYSKTADWLVNIERDAVLIRAREAQAARAAARRNAAESSTLAAPAVPAPR
jgi:RNA polymerase sigma factor (sigma-70 family)